MQNYCDIASWYYYNFCMEKYDIELSCECGKFSGAIKQSKAASGNHLVCACDDCKSFLYWLKKDNSLYSLHEGAELYQTTPSSFQIKSGKEFLKLFRLSPKGLDRWYVNCCNSPIANCIGAKQNFIGFSTQNFKFNSLMDKQLKIGEISAVCNSKIEDRKADIPHYKKFPLSVGFKVAKFLLSGKIKTQLCRNPLYEEGEPIGETILIDLESRKEILQNI